jgi:hypothetical protein
MWEFGGKTSDSSARDKVKSMALTDALAGKIR